MARTPKRKTPAKREATRGRRRKAPKGDRLNRTRLAERLKIDRKTLSKYLSLDGAPKPDRQMRYSIAEARAWIERVAVRLPNSSDEYKALTLSIKRMEAEDIELV
jgi:transcriptional regulator with XRE-family HTH domain